MWADVGISRYGVSTENAPKIIDFTGRLPRRVFNAPRNDKVVVKLHSHRWRLPRAYGPRNDTVLVYSQKLKQSVNNGFEQLKSQDFEL